MARRTDDTGQVFDAVVVAGGAATRFGADKTRAALEGVPLLDRVLAAVTDADSTIVVADPRPVPSEVLWVREDPAGSGPANAVVAALDHIRAPLVVLLAADLPYVTTGTVGRLLAAADAAGLVEGAVLRDPTGRLQYLCVAARTDALRAAAAGRGWADASMRQLLSPLTLVPVDAHGREAFDVDEPGDLHPGTTVTT